MAVRGRGGGDEIGPDGVSEARRFSFSYAEGPEEAGLKGGCASKCEPWQSGSYIHDDILERPTVRTAREFIKTLQAVPDDAKFTIADLLSFEGQAESVVVAMLRDSMAHSPTLRLLFWNALAKGQPAFVLKVVDKARPVTSLEQRTIIVPPPHEILSRSFRTHLGPRSFEARHAYVHELVHAMTGLKDETGGAPALHRGPVVYFANRILREVEADVPERLVYKSLAQNEAESAGADGSTALANALRENQVLDWKLSRRLNLNAQSLVLGQALGERATVKGMLRVQEILSSVSSDASLTGMEQRLRSRFSVLRAEGMSLEDYFGGVHHMGQWAMSTYSGSRLFSKIFEYGFPESSSTQWRIVLQPDSAGSELTTPWRVDHASHSVDLYSTALYCMTHAGAAPLSRARALLGMFIELSLGRAIPSEAFDLQTNRGYQVFLENAILEQTRPMVPRINAMLSSSRSELEPAAFKASLAATQENTYLTGLLHLPND